MSNIRKKHTLIIRKYLLDWFRAHRRQLPWRDDRHWYRVWISEIMLQQTQVAQVIPYFERFLKHFPDISSLASSQLPEVLKLWEGLGYYSRARNLHRAARQIVEVFGGNMPGKKSELLTLSGIGPYTAHAILSLAFEQPFSVVDGNVKRVLARLFAITQDIRAMSTVSDMQQICDQLLDVNHPGDFNEAIMELGALVCSPKNPNCTICPLSGLCIARQKDKIQLYPVVAKRKTIPNKNAWSLIHFKDMKMLLAKRPDHGLLGGMWELPQTEVNPGAQKQLIPVSHVYSHFKITLTPIIVSRISKSDLKIYAESKYVHFEELSYLPLHKAMHKLLATNKNFFAQLNTDQKS